MNEVGGEALYEFRVLCWNLMLSYITFLEF